MFLFCGFFFLSIIIIIIIIIIISFPLCFLGNQTERLGIFFSCKFHALWFNLCCKFCMLFFKMRCILRGNLGILHICSVFFLLKDWFWY